MSLKKWADYPTATMPTIVEGEIWGPVRCESLSGHELFLPEAPGGKTRLINFKPFEAPDPKTGQLRIWAVTHLQKKSKKGWLKTNPYCFHKWNFSKLQKQDANGGWIPGTEKGWYFRMFSIPYVLTCWRWDVAGTKVDGVLRHWIRSNGIIWGHLD